MSSFADSGHIRRGKSAVTFSGSGGDVASLSSVGADGDLETYGGVGLYDDTTPLYQRLKELDALTSSFLSARLATLF